ncbi:hypothetical protein ABZ671_23030 [Micromonospora sp. NPDC006766]|uniref:hypothetical protein n=1 Tax=Micromonospora sp. NPDC006766 TaxID=3154778 RepID=UPI0033EEF7E3
MRAARFVAALAAPLAVVAVPGTAHAATISQPFYADSGDACRYGVTEGTLGWRFGTASPLPVLGVDVNGKLTDRPVLNGPGTCASDGYYSSATFIAYAGTVEVDRQTRTADNSVVPFTFTMPGNATKASVNRVVIQVCRSPVITLPPSYCGTPVTYLAPPVA